MCLAIPMKIVSMLPGGRGVVSCDDNSADNSADDAGGTTCEVDLSLTPGVQPGDYVIVHAGLAIETLDREEADARLALFAAWGAAQRAESGESGGSEESGESRESGEPDT
ncbi:MAG: HypC/HybG/HupF family hydrogenase formation chaperone [Myxococcales bacterium]|jgi:hydrogenase expression/formation protein HypC|nr:HypC/HybG/HupF family hydrogenase formation chaperone [Myxococcales bacterium]